MTTPAKYCSSRCRTRKVNKLDRKIEDTFLDFLNGEGRSAPPGDVSVVATPKKGKGEKKVKGDTRILVSCDAVEVFMFGPRNDPEHNWGRKKNKARRGTQDDDKQKASQATAVEDSTTVSDHSTEETKIDGDVLARLSIRSGTRIRPPQNVSEVNGSVGGEKGRAERIRETPEMLEKRRWGGKKADEHERVRRAARRGVVFGFVVGGAEGREIRRKCEAVMQGKVVEPSFAKGDWSIRWRE